MADLIEKEINNLLKQTIQIVSITSVDSLLTSTMISETDSLARQLDVPKRTRSSNVITPLRSLALKKIIRAERNNHPTFILYTFNSASILVTSDCVKIQIYRALPVEG